MNDAIRMVCERAVRRFGHLARDAGGSGCATGGMFNASGFAQAMADISGTGGLIDGLVVRVILCGRPDIRLCSGGSHYRLLDV